jgi:SAM-dependent methyltransferase
MPTNQGVAARFKEHPRLRRVVNRLGEDRSVGLVQGVHPLLEGAIRMVDIGAGTGHVSAGLERLGLDVTPVDVADFSFVDGLAVTVYDGERLPFTDDSFDAALLCSVLHHVPDQDGLIAEAARVAPRVVVVEDVHQNRLHEGVASLVDRVTNLELDGTPHRYRDDPGWRRCFAAHGLTVVQMRRWASLGGLFRHVAYRLERD